MSTPHQHRWTIEKAATEFEIDRRTLTKRLTTEGITPGPDGKFSTAEIVRAIHGSYEAERTRKMKHDANLAALEEAEKVKKLIPITDALLFLEGTAIAIRQRILGSSMTEQEKDDILNEICRLRLEDYITAAEESLGIKISYKSGLYDDLYEKETLDRYR